MPYPHHLHTAHRPFPVQVVQPAGKFIVEVILLHSELLHDIQADIQRLEKQRHLEETPILSADDSDMYSVCRLIDLAVNRAQSRCQAYTFLPSPFVRHISTNHTHRWEEKNIMLAMPQRWPMHLVDVLRDDIHNYIVKSVEYQLLSIALPQDGYTALCQQMAEDSYDDINVHLNARLGPTTIHPTFLG